MFAKDLISDSIIPLRTSDTGITALNLMDELKVSHLPIVNTDKFLGLISDTDIYSFNNPEEALGNHQLSLKKPFVRDHQHIFDVIKIVSSMKLSLLPVLDKKDNFVGVITLIHLVQNFAEISAIQNPGSIIILELNVNDYSLSEIGQIVESNDAKILGLYIRTHTDSTKIDVSIKLNKNDISPIIKTFNRYDYIIKATFSEDEKYYNDLQDRFDSLMNYLNI